MPVSSAQLDRAHGSLAAMAIGDALGMPTQTLTREQIRCHYGEINGFVSPFTEHPVSHGLRAGQVTDDTEQTLLLANRLISGAGHIDEQQLGRDLLEWEAGIKARGLRDLLGPSTKAALNAMLSGVPITDTGLNGTTNGAAMRIAPVGIAASLAPQREFIDQVEMACRLTHNTGVAIAAASAVAAVVSSGVAGAGFNESITTALSAAETAQKRGHCTSEYSIAAHIAMALSAVDDGADLEQLATQIGTSVACHESVAAAFGVVRLANGDPWQATLMAANIGDDTDTIGAIAGAMAGACVGMRAIPQHAVDTIQANNTLALEDTARALLHLRETGQSAVGGAPS